MTLVPPRTHHSHDLRNAWIALALFPVAYLVAALVGGAILAGLGYAEQEPVPLGTALAVGLPLVVLLALPAAIGCWLGLRARRAGDDRGNAPAVLGGALVAFTLLTTLVGLVAR
ncbi:MAG: hypothetical protein ACTHOK_01915 [Nocardioidaceae bacterium]